MRKLEQPPKILTICLKNINVLFTNAEKLTTLRALNLSQPYVVVALLFNSLSLKGMLRNAVTLTTIEAF